MQGGGDFDLQGGRAYWQPASSDRPLQGLTLLVVEDSRLASEAVRLLCLRSGARIRRADCPRSAARHLRNYRPAAVIVDLGLPDGNGTQLIAQIAGGADGPAVLGMSGDPDAQGAAMAAGAGGFLAKPVENLALFQQVVLSALPAHMRWPGPRALPDDMLRPGPAGLREDLAHAAKLLDKGPDRREIDYITHFLAGVARISGDRGLEDAAARLQDGQDRAAGLEPISGLLRERLSAHLPECPARRPDQA